MSWPDAHSRGRRRCVRRKPPKRRGWRGVLVVERNMFMHVIENRLDAWVPWSRAAEELPSCIREQIDLTIATAKQEDKGLIWQRSDGVLSSVCAFR